MTFSKYVCWKPEMIRKVMDVEATQPKDHIFLATHSPIKMYRQSLTEAKSKVEYNEERFLEDFLGTSDFAFVPVLGTSGTGKSHLIRWLYTRIHSIRKAPKYRVLLIPKVGTNLRDILELVLTDIEGAEFDEYRNRLRQATSMLTEAEAREQLLANLAITVGPSGKHDRSNLSDEQNYLIEALPALLYDPFFREHWLRKEGIIHQLVIHTFGRRDSIEIIEERRQFSLEDLPLNAREIAKASAQAREFYSLLIGNDDIQKATVTWLNTHLDEAIARVLNLGREDLQRLMLDVRRALARKGVELILLIEDFAKLQGIDREVLEAVLARPQQGKGEPLCAMRTALACTTGYFEGLIDTVRTRADFSVSLDVETVDEQSLVTPADVEQLVTRYLNAVRLDEQEIRSWSSNRDNQTGKPLDLIPKACTTCEYQTACHKGFGAVDGVGLYPFNSTAIERMRLRTNKGVFNPRILIKDVLRYTLEYHQSDLEEGRFPSPLLLEHFGGSKLSALVIKDINDRDKSSNARRREALLNLWNEGNKLRDLSEEVHTAFDLPRLGIQEQEIINPKPESAVPTTTSSLPTASTAGISTSRIDEIETDFIPKKLGEQIQFLNQWGTGNSLPQSVAQDLYPLIFDALAVRVNWDACLLLKTKFFPQFFKAGTNIHFRNDFKGRHVGASYELKTKKGINLLLPITSEESDWGETTLALQAILLYQHYKHWRFDDGITYFLSYAKKVEEWSNFVLSEISKLPSKSRTAFDPVPAVVELLAITGRMAGCTTVSLENLIDSAFADLEKADISNRTETWQKLFKSLKKYQPKLREILESRIPCTKGNRSVLQIIDAAQLIKPLKSVASTWQPQANVSNISEDPPFDAISKARKSVDELLEQAVLDERNRHLRIYRRVLEELGEEFSQVEVVEALQKAIEKTTAIGAFRGVNRNDLNQAMEDFKGVRLKDYLGKMQKLQNMNEVATLLPLLSSLSERPVEVVTKFLDTACKFLEKSQDVVQNYRANLKTEGGNELEGCCQTIEQSLLELQQLTNSLKGETSCS